MRVFRPYAWFGPIAAVLMAVCGAAPAAAQPVPAGSNPSILPASKLGSNWVLSKPPVTNSSGVEVDYENRVDYPALPRRVTTKLETLTDTTPFDHLLTVLSQSSVTPDPRPLGDVLGVKSVMVQGFLATVTYDFRVGHTGVLLSVEGAARDAEDVAAQARQFAELEQDFRRAAGDKAPDVLPPPTAAIPRNDCMRFVADLSIPDGTRVDPGADLTKSWRLENCGDTVWDNFQAVRVGGEYGPESFSVPRTEPRQPVDLSTQLQSPLTSGCHRATYRLAGPRGQFGSGAFVEVVVVNGDAAPPASEPNLDDPSTLVLLPTDLGEGWCTASVRPSGDYTVTFHNSADFPAPRDALISLTRSDTADDAAPSLVSLLLALGPQIPLDYGDWAIGDATGVRLVTTDVPDRGQIHVYYEFNVEHITSLVEVHGSQDEVSEIDAQALEFAQAEESWLRKCFAARAQSLQ